MTSSKDPTGDSETSTKDPSDASVTSTKDSTDPTEEAPPRALTSSEIEELQRNPGAGALRVGDGLSVEHNDLIARAAYASREKSSSSDSD